MTNTIRDWRGNKTQVSRCTSQELASILAESTAMSTRIERFVRAIQVELEARLIRDASAHAA